MAKDPDAAEVQREGEGVDEGDTTEDGGER